MPDPSQGLDEILVSCPYCGERLDLLIDPSAGDQHYTEDCQVCCQPMVVRVQFGFDGVAVVEALREDDTF